MPFAKVLFWFTAVLLPVLDWLDVDDLGAGNGAETLPGELLASGALLVIAVVSAFLPSKSPERKTQNKVWTSMTIIAVAVHWALMVITGQLR